MIDVASLQVIFGADTSKFTNGINSVKQGMSSVSQHAGNMITDVLGFIGKIGIAAGLAGIAFTGLAVGAAAGAQTVTAQLDAVLKSTRNAAGITKSMVEGMANQLSTLTRFSNEAIIAADAVLLRFTKIGRDVFPDASKMVLDMATALGVDASSAAEKLGKILNSPADAFNLLNRMGIRLNDTLKQSIRHFIDLGDVADAQRIILNSLGVQFAGAAVAAGNTFAGQVDILRNQLEELAQSLGGILLPVLTDGLKGINAFFAALRENAGAVIGNIVVSIGDFAANFLRILGFDDASINFIKAQVRSLGDGIGAEINRIISIIQGGASGGGRGALALSDVIGFLNPADQAALQAQYGKGGTYTTMINDMLSGKNVDTGGFKIAGKLQQAINAVNAGMGNPNQGGGKGSVISQLIAELARVLATLAPGPIALLERAGTAAYQLAQIVEIKAIQFIGDLATNLDKINTATIQPFVEFVKQAGSLASAVISDGVIRTALGLYGLGISLGLIKANAGGVDTLNRLPPVIDQANKAMANMKSIDKGLSFGDVFTLVYDAILAVVAVGLAVAVVLQKLGVGIAAIKGAITVFSFMAQLTGIVGLIALLFTVYLTNFGGFADKLNALSEPIRAVIEGLWKIFPPLAGLGLVFAPLFLLILGVSNGLTAISRALGPLSIILFPVTFVFGLLGGAIKFIADLLAGKSLEQAVKDWVGNTVGAIQPVIDTIGKAIKAAAQLIMMLAFATGGANSFNAQPQWIKDAAGLGSVGSKGSSTQTPTGHAAGGLVSAFSGTWVGEQGMEWWSPSTGGRIMNQTQIARTGTGGSGFNFNGTVIVNGVVDPNKVGPALVKYFKSQNLRIDWGR